MAVMLLTSAAAIVLTCSALVAKLMISSKLLRPAQIVAPGED